MLCKAVIFFSFLIKLSARLAMQTLRYSTINGRKFIADWSSQPFCDIKNYVSPELVWLQGDLHKHFFQWKISKRSSEAATLWTFNLSFHDFQHVMHPSTILRALFCHDVPGILNTPDSCFAMAFRNIFSLLTVANVQKLVRRTSTERAQISRRTRS